LIPTPPWIKLLLKEKLPPLNTLNGSKKPEPVLPLLTIASSSSKVSVPVKLPSSKSLKLKKLSRKFTRLLRTPNMVPS